MKKITLFICFFTTSFISSKAQNISKDSSLEISGSLDIYYKYDLSAGYNIQSPENVVLGVKQNSVDFGMFDLRLKKQTGKASFFAELAFGARPTYNLTDPQLAYNIQNLNMSYEVSKKLTFTGGLMYRLQTFERMTPADNFNYSMSYTFLNQYFLRTAGIKAVYSFSNNLKLVAGFYNSYDAAGASNPTVASPAYGLSDFCAQLFFVPVEKIKASAAVWVEGQKNNGVHLNAQTKYDASDKIKLGINATYYTCKDAITALHSFNSVAFYAQYAINKYTIGARLENMNNLDPSNNAHYFISTFTGSWKLGPICLKQEIKFDNSDQRFLYIDKKGLPTNNAAQVVVAAIYAF